MFFAQKLRCLVGVAALTALLGCGGGKIPQTHYYTLSLAAPTPSSQRLEATGIVMPLRTTKVISRDHIAYRESREEVGFYEYHKWAEDPRSEIADALTKQLLARGTFSSLTAFDGRTTADYFVRGGLKRLEEVDYEPPVSAVVEIELELVDADTAKVVWSGVATKTGAVTSGDVRSVVSGLSAAADEGIRELVEELDSYLRSQS